MRFLFGVPLSLLLSSSAGAVTIWTVGIDNNTQLFTPENPGTGGGEMANFVIESGGPNPLGGDALTADDDYYFAGTYDTVLDGGSYSAVGTVVANEENVERAFVPTDPDLRFHFNLPTSVTATDALSVSFDFFTMDLNGLALTDPDLFWDVEVLMNGVSVGMFNVTADAIENQLNPGNVELTTPAFTLADVNGMAGAGFDNYVTLRGTNAGSSSRWMSLDYVQLDAEPIPEPNTAGLLILGLSVLGSVVLHRRR